jgi:mannose-6-phosphate isomerase-like protein (cupin superfamily)
MIISISILSVNISYSLKTTSTLIKEEEGNMGTSARIIRAMEARTFMEGPELCREYIRTSKMWFGTSTLQPGQRGNIDNGHSVSQEVFYCCQGHILLFDEDQYYELFGGDAIFVPEGLPHTLINIGEETAVLVWAGAPGE